MNVRLVNFLAGPLQLSRLLCRMRVVRTCIDLESLKHFRCQLVLWQHATHRVIDQVFGLSLQAVPVAFQSQARMSGVPCIVPNTHFLACHGDFVRVGHDDKISTINVRRVLRAMFAHQHDSNIAGETTEHFIRGIHDEPLLFNFAGFGDGCRLSDHESNLLEKSSGLVIRGGGWSCPLGHT